MAITEQDMIRVGALLTMEVTSDLVPVLRTTRLGPSGSMPRLGDESDIAATTVVYFHWYIDGVHIAETTSGRYSFYLPSGDQVRVEVLDTTDRDFDPVANAPAGYPARRELLWTRNTDARVSHYRIEQQKDGGAWTILARVREKIGVWEHRYRTARLTDLATYSWRIVPVDITSGGTSAGNDGTVLTIGPEKIVRTPDAPNFTATLDDATQKVTFAAA